jgi:predicted AlkP superfamily phosphohydrolase/phosphomutase
MSRTVIIGLDGVPFDMLKDFADSGVMPNMAAIIKEGVFRKMYSTIPEISSVAWSSMITGKNPGEHGIFGFMDLFPNSYNTRFPNYSDLKAAPFWDQRPGTSVIINVPSTYPVRQMRGVHISGFVSIDMQRSVHPQALLRELEQIDYRLDVDSQKAHESMELFLKDLDRTLEARIECYRYLWDSEDWQTFMLVFTGTDRLMHFLWDAYEDKDHRYHESFIRHFQRIDEAIGEITARMSDDDVLIMLSDHGFERLDKDVYVNYVLRDSGFLQFNGNHEMRLNKIAPGTKAFALDPARIYLNYKDKYPCGTVMQDETEGLVAELEVLLGSLEVDGRKVVRRMFRKDQAYAGPFRENAPDLVLIGAEGFNLKAKPNAQVLAEKGIFTGKHTQDTAFLIARGIANSDCVPQRPSVSDVTSIIPNHLS